MSHSILREYNYGWSCWAPPCVNLYYVYYDLPLSHILFSKIDSTHKIGRHLMLSSDPKSVNKIMYIYYSSQITNSSLFPYTSLGQTEYSLYNIYIKTRPTHTKCILFLPTIDTRYALPIPPQKKMIYTLPIEKKKKKKKKKKKSRVSIKLIKKTHITEQNNSHQ